LNCSRIG